MMHNNATIMLRRLVIRKEGKIAYDQSFHKGVNIIRSRGNSTGKTTIMDAIFFVLGGDVEEWTAEAASCDFVDAEVAFSGRVVSCRREIGDGRYPPMYIYEGPYEQAIGDSVHWLKFGIRRSSERESFSQALFRLLGYPERKLATFANITIHEVLRLVYSDQLTAVNKIFRNQNFDSEETRQTVGELMLGVDDLDLHELRLRLREDEAELVSLAGKLKAMERVFAVGGLAADGVEIRLRIDKCRSELEELRQRIASLEASGLVVRENTESEEARGVRLELLDSKRALREARERLEQLECEIEDSVRFVASLRERTGALNESEATRACLGELKFEFCPACLSVIEASVECGPECCHLCKHERVDEADSTGFLRMQFELNYQIRESEQLLAVRRAELDGLTGKMAELEFRQETLQARFNSFMRTADPVEAELKDALKVSGQREEMLEGLMEKEKLVTIIKEIMEEKGAAAQRISILQDQLRAKAESSRERRVALQKRISDIAVGILKSDIPSEETFAGSTEVEFDFAKNKMFVDGRSKFSASSVCYLKTAFLFAIFLASLKDGHMLFPRLCLFDNIEDKGSTPARVQNMHRVIIESLNGVTTDHQIIFTTCVLADEWNGSEFCVGPEYSFELKTLNIG